MAETSFPHDEYRSYLRTQKVPEPHFAVYETTAEKFLSTFPEVSLQSLGRKHLDQYLEDVFKTGASAKLLRNLNIVCDTFLKFARNFEVKEEAAPTNPTPLKTAVAAAALASALAPVPATTKPTPTPPAVSASGTARTKIPTSRPPRVKPVGLFSLPPCPQCGADLTTETGGSGVEVGMKLGGIGGAMIAHAFSAKFSCAQHGLIDSDAFPDAHQWAIVRRRCAFGGLGVGVLLVCIVLVTKFS